MASFTGYMTLDEIADALSVSVTWLEEELLEELTDRQLTLYGESNYFASDLQQWFNRRHYAIVEEQKRCRAIAREITPRISALNPTDTC